MPHLPYNRQERKAKPREPISAKVLLNALVEAAGATQIIALDPHAPATQGFVDIPFQYLTAFHLVTEYIRELIGGGRLSAGFVPASPDAGRGKLARRLGKEVSGPGADFVVVDKDRPMAGESAVATVIGKVRERDVIIYDDLVDSGGTLRNAALALKGRGAKGIYVVAIHGVFSPVVINSPEELATIRQFLTSQGKRIEDYVKSGPDGPIVNALIRLQADPNIDGIIFTDSLSVPEQNIIDRLKTVIIPVSPVLATACGRIIQGGSLVGYQYEGW
jgi:ribose-phosphate pyrophosphokinase